MTVWHSVLLEQRLAKAAFSRTPIADMEAAQKANEAAGRAEYERTRLLGMGYLYPWEKLTSSEKRAWCISANPDLVHRL